MGGEVRGSWTNDGRVCLGEQKKKQTLGVGREGFLVIRKTWEKKRTKVVAETEFQKPEQGIIFQFSKIIQLGWRMNSAWGPRSVNVVKRGGGIHCLRTCLADWAVRTPTLLDHLVDQTRPLSGGAQHEPPRGGVIGSK